MGHTGPLTRDDTFSNPPSDELTGQRFINYGVPGPWYGGRATSSARFVDQRPISVHNPKSDRGWREPSGYFRFVATVKLPRVGRKVISNSAVQVEYADRATEWDPTIPDTTLNSYVVNAALIKCRNALTANGAQLGLMFAERAKTSDMIINRIGSIAKDVRQFRKRMHPRHWRDIVSKPKHRSKGQYNDWIRNLQPGSKRFANEWNEMQYGWVPTLSDINNASHALYDAEAAHRANGLNNVFARATVRVDDVRDAEGVWGSEAAEINMATRFSRWSAALVRLDYAIETPELRMLNDFGLINPLSIAWELVPFSFVVDWAFPIGPYLESLSATAGMSFIAGSATTLVRHDEHAIGTNFSRPAVNVPLNISRLGSRSVMSLQRYKYYSSPVPYPPTPLDGKYLSAGRRGANALALLASAFGGRR